MKRFLHSRYTMVRICIFFLVHVMYSTLAAQQGDADVTGTILDKSSKSPIEFATVQLLNLVDSSVLNTAITDRKGKFLLEKVKHGQYVLQSSYIGYEKIIMPVTVDQSRENLGNIEIGILTTNMREVTVTSRKSLLNTSIDRKVYNVGQDIMAISGSVSDILKNIPSVEVDIEGQVSLRGSGDVMILINGRPSPLMGRSKAEILQQIPANTIERIEVITNPSARFKPDGTSGIINIVMKKNTRAGWNGLLIGNIGNRGRINGSLNLNYKPGKWNFFGNYNIRYDRRTRYNTIDRQYLDSTGQPYLYYQENNYSPARPLNHIISVGTEYAINERNSIGISANSHHRDQVRTDIMSKIYYDKNHVLSSHYDRLRNSPEYELEKDVSAFWQHNFPKEDKELRVELNVASSDEQEDNHFTDQYYFPVRAPAMDRTVIFQRDNQQELTIDYSDPLTDESKLETGYDGSFNQIDMDFLGEYFDTIQQLFIKDLAKSNRFKYKEAIHALYGTYQRNYESFGYSVGLRLEQATIRGNLITKDSLFSNHYLKAFPTLHLSYRIHETELQLNYSKRVNRPDGDDLNPFPEYQDPYNLRAGNPKLLPEMIHSFEFGLKWQNENFSFVPSLYYRVRTNGFTTVTIPLNDSVLLTTEQNLSNDKSAGLEFIFSAKGKSISANLNTNFFYNSIDASNLGYSNRRSIISMSTNFNSTVTITKTTLLQVSGNYRSARLTPQGKTFSSFVLNSGMRQDLFKNKVSLTFTFSDILNSLKQRSELNSPYIKQTSLGRRDSRIIYLGISYRFGKGVKKNTEEKLQFDDSL